MLSVETADATTSLIDAIVDKFDSLKTRAGIKFAQLNTLLVNKNQDLQTKLVILTNKTNELLLGSFTQFVADVGLEFDGLFENILEGWNTLGDDSLTAVQEDTKAIVSEFSGLGESILGKTEEEGLRKLKNDIVGIWETLKTDQEQPLQDLKTQILGVWIDDDDSIFASLQTALFGTGDGQNSPVWNLGYSIMSGIAKGITDNGYLVKSALSGALIGSLTEVKQSVIDAGSPSRLFADEVGQPISQGIAMGILEGAGLIAQSAAGVVNGALGSAISPLISSGSSSAIPSSVSNISNTTNLNLNVNSASSSQGIIDDFRIMKTMAAI